MNRPQPGERKRPGDFVGGVLDKRSRITETGSWRDQIKELLCNKKGGQGIAIEGVSE